MLGVRSKNSKLYIWRGFRGIYGLAGAPDGLLAITRLIRQRGDHCSAQTRVAVYGWRKVETAGKHASPSRSESASYLALCEPYNGGTGEFGSISQLIPNKTVNRHETFSGKRPLI